MAKITETTGKKASDYFKVEGFKDGVLHIAINLQKPSEENVSGSGETYVIGRAFGKLPFMLKGKNLKINASVMVPLSDVEKARIKAERKATAAPEAPKGEEITL